MVKDLSKHQMKKSQNLLQRKKIAIFLEAFHPHTSPERRVWLLKRFHGALLVWTKFKIREFLTAQQALEEQSRVVLQLKKQLEAIGGEARHFMTYRLNKVYEAIEILEKAESDCWQELSHIGRYLFVLMSIYDNYATLHDKAQILNVHHSKLENIVAKAKDKQAHLFYQLVLFYRAEPVNNAPFFHALFAALTDEINHNEEMREALWDKIDELFPLMPKYRLMQNVDGSSILERIPPNLKVINPDGSSRIIRRWKPTH